jgi:hypothetical protein
LFLLIARLTSAQPAPSEGLPLLPLVLLGTGALAALGSVLFLWGRRTTEKALLERGRLLDDHPEYHD